jgi:hypothetical protein
LTFRFDGEDWTDRAASAKKQLTRNMFLFIIVSIKYILINLCTLEGILNHHLTASILF